MKIQQDVLSIQIKLCADNLGVGQKYSKLQSLKNCNRNINLNITNALLTGTLGMLTIEHIYQFCFCSAFDKNVKESIMNAYKQNHLLLQRF
jgi:hypothetical protein